MTNTTIVNIQHVPETAVKRKQHKPKRAHWKFKTPQEIQCQVCGTTVAKRGNYQKYCIECSERAAQERKNKWNRADPTRSQKSVVYNRRRKSETIKSGEQTSKNYASSIGVGLADEIDSPWVCRVSLPFEYAASKNFIYGFANHQGGHIFKRRRSRDFRDALTLKIQSAMRGIPVYQNNSGSRFLFKSPTCAAMQSMSSILSATR